AEASAVDLAKQAVALLLERAVERHGARLHEEQRLITVLGDAIVDCFAIDSALGRAHRAPTSAHRDLAALWCFDVRPALGSRLRAAAAMVAEDDDRLREAILRLDRRVDCRTLEDRISQRLIDADRYV